MDENAMRNALRMNSDSDQNMCRNANALGEILPSIQNSHRGKAMSDEQLRALHRAFFPNADINDDSDDSLIDNSEFLPADQIQEFDSKMRKCYASIATMDEENERAKMICMIGKETKKQREQRRKLLAMRTDGLTNEEREAAEARKKKERQRIAKKLNRQIQLFSKANDKKARYLTCSTFSSILEILADLISLEEDPENDHRRKVKEIDDEVLDNKFHLMGIKKNFYVGNHGRSVENYVKKKVKQILGDENVQWLFGNVFGFNFDARKSILCLENYYSLRPSYISEPDNGKSIAPLEIDIRELLKSAYNTERSENPSFRVNENLKWALFESD